MQSLNDFYPSDRESELHVHRKQLYPSRLVSPPHRQHHHRDHIISHYPQRHSRSLSRVSRSVSPSANLHRRNASATNSHVIGVGGNRTEYRNKLNILQRQLSSAQQNQVASLREYDRHYK